MPVYLRGRMRPASVTLLAEQIGILVIERVSGKVNLWLRPRGAFFRLAAARTAAVLVGMGLRA